MQPSGPGLFCVGRFLVTVSSPFLVVSSDFQYLHNSVLIGCMLLRNSFTVAVNKHWNWVHRLRLVREEVEGPGTFILPFYARRYTEKYKVTLRDKKVAYLCGFQIYIPRKPAVLPFNLDSMSCSHLFIVTIFYFPSGVCFLILTKVSLTRWSSKQCLHFNIFHRLICQHGLVLLVSVFPSSLSPASLMLISTFTNSSQCFSHAYK